MLNRPPIIVIHAVAAGAAGVQDVEDVDVVGRRLHVPVDVCVFLHVACDLELSKRPLLSRIFQLYIPPCSGYNIAFLIYYPTVVSYFVFHFVCVDCFRLDVIFILFT